MNDILFEFLAAKTLGVLGLSIVILAIRPIVLKWLNANVAYKLWLVIPVFMLLPVNWFESAAGSSFMIFFSNANVNLPTMESIDTSMANNFSGQILALWLAGFVISLSVFAFRYKKLVGSLKKYSFTLPKELIGQDKALNIQVVQTSLVEMPAIFGLVKSFLILPRNFESYPKERQMIILSHELYHLRRRDHHINFIRTLIRGIFWFNPIIYWADKYVEADQELSCDLGVLQSAEQFGLRQYGETLLDAISMEPKASLVSQWNYRNLIKVRIKMMTNIKQKRWHSWVAATVALLSIWTAASVTATENKNQAEPIPTKIINPGYPSKAISDGIEGYVRFQFNLDQNNQVTDAKIIASKPEGIFDKVALEAFNQWQFKSSNGQNNLRYTMEFLLAEPSQELTAEERAKYEEHLAGSQKRIRKMKKARDELSKKDDNKSKKTVVQLNQQIPKIEKDIKMLKAKLGKS